MTKTKTRWCGTVVARLEIALVAVVLSILVAAFLSGRQMLELRRVETDVFARALPALQTAQSLGGDLTALLGLTTVMTHDLPDDRLADLNQTMQEITARLQTFMPENFARALPQETRAETLARLDSITNRVEEIFAVQTQRNELRGHGDRLLATLRGIQTDIQQSTEVLVLDAAARLRSIASDLSVARGDLSAQVANLNALIDFKADLLGVFFLVDSLEQLESNENLPRIEQGLQFRTRSAAQTLFSIGQIDNRRSLALQVDQIRTLLLKEGGLVDTTRKLSQATARLEGLASDEIRDVATLSALLTRQISENEADFERGRATLSATVNRLLWIGSLTIASIIITAALVHRFVLRRQIGIRMSRLADAVTKISQGKLETPVDVSGSDEVARIAEALAVFKGHAQDLVRSNADLERFAFAASHDMRAPLNAIYDLASWTLEDEGPNLTESGRDNLEILMQRAARLRRLSADLLTYARIGTQEEQYELISLGQLVDDIAELADPGKSYNVTLQGPLQETTVPVALVRQILLNLVGNSVKHHDRTAGQIDILAQETDGRLKISVTDDGPGIPPEYHDRIFAAFQTLQSRDDVEGSGMGLAIIIKLVSNIGGKIEIIPTAPRFDSRGFPRAA